MEKLEGCDRVTKFLFTVIDSFFYVYLEFPASGDTTNRGDLIKYEEV